MRPTGQPASRPLPRRAEELDPAAGRVRVPLLRRRLARADHRLRDARRPRSRTAGRWSSTGSPRASIRAQATLFIQSQVPEHAELHLLLSMITPLGWLERVPTYKDQQEKLADRDLATYGFLGYPLLQAADILIYRANMRAGGRGPGAARRDHARGRAALQPPLRPRAGLRGEGQGGGEEARQRRRRALLNELRTKFQEQGDSRGARARRARCSKSSRTSRAATASGCYGYLEGARHEDPAPSRRRCSPRRRRCRASTARRCRSPTATRSPARGAGRGREEDQAPCRPTRRACGAPTRAIRRSARCGSCTRSTRDARRKDWVQQGLHARPASAASSASSR